jgi:hypothetical protein
MRKLFLSLGVVLVFALGCAFGAARAGLANAHADDAQRWAYLCFQAGSADDVHVKANAAGERGWDMASAASAHAGASIWCFRKPRR